VRNIQSIYIENLGSEDGKLKVYRINKISFVLEYRLN
jgi:hypothetical protein